MVPTDGLILSLAFTFKSMVLRMLNYECDCHTDLRIVESFSLFSTLMGSFCKSRMKLAVQAKMFDRSEEGVVRRVAKTWSSLQAWSSI